MDIARNAESFVAVHTHTSIFRKAINIQNAWFIR